MGVRDKVSSAYFPYSLLRAEEGVKTMKRLLRGKLGPVDRRQDKKKDLAPDIPLIP